MNPTELEVILPIRAWARFVERTGWEIQNVEVDVGAGRLRIEAERFDGRLMVLDVTPRSGVLETSVVDVERAPGRRIADDVTTHLLSRTRIPAGAYRAALRILCTRLADNPPPGFPMLPAEEIRRALAPALSAGSLKQCRHGQFLR